MLKGQFEFQRLAFAAVILTGLGLVFLQSMAMYYWASSGQAEAAKSIFETCKTVIPPIITLVLGYYFGKSDQHQSQNNSSNPQDPSVESGGTQRTKGVESKGVNPET
ncbi:MAG: hypothetical protein MH252_02700 [Thermosynechococcaceae cyanobacterium MS004]|nr:hypothetical protein [Thermosynechococcaceae cyanobacterium MS004]